MSELIAKASNNGKQLTLNTLKDVVATNSKKRFSFSEDEKKIRANQGHSVKIDLGLVPKEPPVTLYHGTTTHFLDSISIKGLLRGNRHHVHLSSDAQTAIKVGQRHGKPVVLTVNSKGMYKQGYNFYLSQNKVWLTRLVPPEFIVSQNENEEL